MNARKAAPKTGYEAPELATLVAAGAVLHARLHARRDGFFAIEVVLRTGGVVPLLARWYDQTQRRTRREARLFSDPAAALKVIREAGITRGEFVLDEWVPGTRPGGSRSDQTESLKAIYEAARMAKEHGLLPPGAASPESSGPAPDLAKKSPTRRRKTPPAD